MRVIMLGGLVKVHVRVRCPLRRRNLPVMLMPMMLAVVAVRMNMLHGGMKMHVCMLP